MLYGYEMEIAFPVFSVFFIGDVTALSYIAVYWRYTTERRRMLRISAAIGMVLLVVTIYAILGGTGYLGQNRHSVQLVMGVVADVVAVTVQGVPMETIVRKLLHKSTDYFQVHKVVASSINNASWLAFGLATHNWFVIGPNMVFLALGISVLVVYAVLNLDTRQSSEDYSSTATTTKLDNEVIISIASTPSDASEPPGCPSSPAFVALISPVMPSIPALQNAEFAAEHWASTRTA